MPNENVNNRCKYYCEETKWQCTRDSLSDSEKGLCICHEMRDDKDNNLFLEEIKRILEDDESDVLHFEGFYFPFFFNFSKIEFGRDTEFYRAFFAQGVNFEQAKFLGNRTCFSRVFFSGKETNFLKVQFCGNETDFSWAQFVGEVATFKEARFSGHKVDFQHTGFIAGSTDFSESHFQADKTDFREAEFKGRTVNFSRAEFQGAETIFGTAKFSGEGTLFIGTKFHSTKTDFSWAELSAEITYFLFAEILNYLDFSYAAFKSKQTKLYYMETNKNSKLVFKNVDLQETNDNDFTQVDLTRCLFLRTKLDYCDFALCEWDWDSRLLNEIMPDDELQPMLDVPPDKLGAKAERFRQAETSYRMLKNNFYTRRAFREAGIFHYREQECRRKALPWYKQWPYWGFKLTCGYGEKPWNPVWSLVFFWLAFAGLFWLLLPIMPEYYADYYPEQVNLWEAASYSFFHIFPLWDLSKWEPASDWSVFFSGLEFLIGAFLIGLFIYVFRRRLDK